MRRHSDLHQSAAISAVLLVLLFALPLAVVVPFRTELFSDDPTAVESEREPFQNPLLLVPVCCLVVRLVLTYRVVSVDPSLTDYYTELLAVVFLALAFYRLSSFAFRAGRTRRFAVYAALAIAFCLATLADRPDPARLLFYLGGAVTLFGFLLQRTAVLAAPWDNT